MTSIIVGMALVLFFAFYLIVHIQQRTNDLVLKYPPVNCTLLYETNGEDMILHQTSKYYKYMSTHASNSENLYISQLAVTKCFCENKDNWVKSVNHTVWFGKDDALQWAT